MLTPSERTLRARSNGYKSTGRHDDARRVMGEFHETVGTRQLAEAAVRLLAGRAAQGLPPQVTDPATLALIVSLIGDHPNHQAAERVDGGDENARGG